MSAQPPKHFEKDFLPRSQTGWQARWFDIVFNHESRPARNFDLVLIVAILASVAVVILASTLRPKRHSVRCQECGLIDHETDAWHCRRCGRYLPET